MITIIHNSNLALLKKNNTKRKKLKPIIKIFRFPQIGWKMLIQINLRYGYKKLKMKRILIKLIRI